MTDSAILVISYYCKHNLDVRTKFELLNHNFSVGITAMVYCLICKLTICIWCKPRYLIIINFMKVSSSGTSTDFHMFSRVIFHRFRFGANVWVRTTDKHKKVICNFYLNFCFGLISLQIFVFGLASTSRQTKCRCSHREAACSCPSLFSKSDCNSRRIKVI